MNINSVGRSLEIYQNSVPQRPVSQVKKPASMGNDSMVLSTTAKDFQTALDAVHKSSDYDQEKVSRLKSAMENGSYRPNSENISEKILKRNFDAII